MPETGSKAAKAWNLALRELRAVRDERPRVGIRRAVAARIRWNLELGSVPDRLVSVEARLAQLEAVPPPAPLDEDVRALALQARVDSAHAARAAERADQISAASEWVDALPPSSTVVSVVIPTRDRAALVAEAIASVQASGHQAWEALVVDDGSEDDTADVLAAIDDPRVRVLRHEEPRGAAAARNTALAQCRGEVVAYLDDDNLMSPRWLRAAVWAMKTHPGTDVVYGAMLHQETGHEPCLYFEPFDRGRLELTNIADQSAIAHRASIDASQDESLEHGADWEALLRMTATKDPLAVPVVATMYRDGAPNRQSRRPTANREWAAIQGRALRGRPLRILGLNSMFPLVTETYIHDELHALELLGAELAWYREHRVPAPMVVSQPVYENLDQAVREFRPDVLFLHWSSFAITQRARLEALGIPFAVRTHSFDQGTSFARDLGEHPLCAGVWSYPAPDGEAPPGTHELVPIFSTHESLPSAERTRELVMTASACLPKKNFPLLFDALDRLPGVDRRVITGLTVGHEPLAVELAAMVSARADPPLLQLSLERSQVHELMSRAAAFIYTLKPEEPFGMPMSIVEALCSGCCVIVPDRPECLAYAGPDARPYTTAADIARHAAEALAGGAAIDAERERNRAYGLERFCSAELGERFLEQLLAGVDRVRAHQAGFAVAPGELGVGAVGAGI